MNSSHGFDISSATETLSKLCICTTGITKELLGHFTTQISSAFGQLYTFLSHNFSIMIYIHTITDLFIIRKAGWTSVICDITGTCTNSWVCINVMCCQCCLKHWNPLLCNSFWNGEVMSKAYLAAEMKWDIHWFTIKCTLQNSIWSYNMIFFLHIRCIDCTVNCEINILLSALPRPAFSSSTNCMIASPWICMSTVYKSCTVFLAYQCLLVQIHPHLSMSGKNNVHLFNGVSWNRGKWKAGSHWAALAILYGY